ncbi:MAG: phosphohistidine phosphatase SixA [Planctomycetes bacterium]|nr:phosphohistidine phosphatase SixA [Planctomycetota bacterium]
MKRIYLTRHGKAEDADPRHGSDADRRLTADGKREVEEVARHLRRIDDKIEIVLTSPLRRAIETAEIIADEFGVALEVYHELNPPMAPSSLITKLRRRGEHRMVLVGHEPGLGQTISSWLKAHSMAFPMKKAAVARLDISHVDGDDAAILAWLAPPELFTR